MTLSISLSPGAEAKLRERAASEGKDPVTYAQELIEDVVTKPTLAEVLDPFRKQVAESGMTDQELEDFYEKMRDEAWAEKQGRGK